MVENFCSFGTSWHYNVPYLNDKLPVIEKASYVGIDLEGYMIRNGKLILSKGIVIKADDLSTGYGVLATGDSYAYPEILEIETVR